MLVGLSPNVAGGGIFYLSQFRACAVASHQTEKAGGSTRVFFCRSKRLTVICSEGELARNSL